MTTRVGDADAAMHQALGALLAPYGLRLVMLAPSTPIPGSYWGDEEAGLSHASCYLRPDTPVHSVLHEAAHFICMDGERRRRLHTDAGGDDLEECAVCLLSILLARALPGYGEARMLEDMDRWGYSFRLGSARAWFELDAGDAGQWLREHALVDEGLVPSGRLRP